MKKILIVGPDINKAKGGMAQVIRTVLEDKELNSKYKIKGFSSYIDGSLPAVIAYGIWRILIFFFTVPFYDLVHIHMTQKGSAIRKGIYVRIAKLFHKRVVIQIHRCEKFTEMYSHSGKLTRWNVKKTLSRADMVLCLSSVWMKTLEEVVGIHNCEYLPNGLDTSSFDYYPDGQYVLYLGRIQEDKGIRELLIAKHLLETEGISFSLKIAGPIDDAKPFIEKAEELRLHDVSFEGWVAGEKKKEMLKNAAIMVLPSYGEGFPVSVLEGIASGCAIVSTDYASIYDMIEEEIIPIKDVNGLADAIDRMWTNPERRRKSIEKNIKHLKEHFEISKVHKKLGDYYEDVLKR